jgi:hypothetical protein
MVCGCSGRKQEQGCAEESQREMEGGDTFDLTFVNPLDGPERGLGKAQSQERATPPAEGKCCD